MHLIVFVKGYKLRRQIARALKNRSRAIASAVQRYNELAVRVPGPPRPSIDVHDVLEYVSVGQFDILRIKDRGILRQPWIRPSTREASIAYFKVRKAREELARTAVEARRLATYMRDVESVLKSLVSRLAEEGDPLAHQVQRRLQWYEYAHAVHRRRLESLEAKGVDCRCGVALCPLDPTAPGTHPQPRENSRSRLGADADTETESDSEEENEARGEEQETVYHVADDDVS